MRFSVHPFLRRHLILTPATTTDQGQQQRRSSLAAASAPPPSPPAVAAADAACAAATGTLVMSTRMMKAASSSLSASRTPTTTSDGVGVLGFAADSDDAAGGAAGSTVTSSDAATTESANDVLLSTASPSSGPILDVDADADDDPNRRRHLGNDTTTPCPPSRSRTIQVLPATVVHLIAAGEVVQRPSNAVKELMENSIDAGATHITVRIEYSRSTTGAPTTTSSAPASQMRLSLLSVSDDGCGMSPQDLALAAQRHATSKLTTQGDLTTLATLGFRGEALSSMSCVSHLCITSRTRHSEVAYRQQYRDGHPVLGEPVACARTPGTTVTMTELFHNLPSRQSSLLNSSEYARIVQDVVQPYAVHCAAMGIGLSCEKVTHSANGASSSVDVNTGCLASIRRLRSTHDETIHGDDDDDAALRRQQVAATQEAIAHLYGYRNVKAFESSSSLSSSSTLKCPRDGDDGTRSGGGGDDDLPSSSRGDDEFLYKCTGCVSSSTLTTTNALSSSSKKRNGGPTTSSTKATSKSKGGGGQLVLFVNHRLVECLPLKRAVDAAYHHSAAMGGNASSSSWFAYLHLQVPSTNVDVNVHPSKRHVTILQLDDICRHIQQSLLQWLEAQGGGPSFRVTSTVAANDQASTNSRPTLPESNVDSQRNDKKKRKAADGAASSSGSDSDHDNDKLDDDKNVKCTRDVSAPAPRKKKPAAASSSSSIAPSKLVRTNRNCQAGALEPFLVSTATARTSTSSSQSTESSTSTTTSTRQSQSVPPAAPAARNSISSTTSSSSVTSTSTRSSTVASDAAAADPSRAEESSPNEPFVHEVDCPLARGASSSDTVDLSQPGAFARLSSMCKCRADRRVLPSQSNGEAAAVKVVRQAFVRPPKVVPTECSYTSVAQLRKRVHKSCHHEWQKKLRKAVFVGVVSRYRSLIQCDEELVEIHHGELATALFYQLALWRFGGADVARLNCPLDVEVLVGSAAQFEDDLSSTSQVDDDADADAAPVASAHGHTTVSKTNQRMAKQVATCLLQKAELLAEYFSILVEERDGTVVLVGLPILLEGYHPAPHGLPNFLLRLATEVDWTEERPCFHDICRELGAYYALLATDPTTYHQVRHLLFPAVSSLLLPSADLVKEPSNSSSSIRVLTSLSKLYRVFERC